MNIAYIGFVKSEQNIVEQLIKGQLISVMRNQFGGHDATHLPAGKQQS